MAQILVVDDDPVVRRMATDLLTAAGHSVQVAEDWVSLSQAFLDSSFDLVLLDVMLPGIDGDRLVRDVQALTDPAPTVVLHSTLSLERLRSKAQQSGAQGFVLKSSSDQALLQSVEAALIGRGRTGKVAQEGPEPSARPAADPAGAPPAPRPPRGPGRDVGSGDLAGPPEGQALAPGTGRDWCPHLLLVDDSPIRRKALSKLFEEQGFEVTPVASGPAALELLRTCRESERPEILVSDVFMPGMDGYDLAEQILALPGLEEMPILLYSSSPEEARLDDDDPRARRFASSAHLRGVVHVDHLSAAVERRIETLGNLRRLRRAREGLD